MEFKRFLLSHVCLVIACSLMTCVVFADDSPASREELVFFETQVKPILQKRCHKCHGSEEAIKGGLRLTSRVGLLTGGDTGPAVSLAAPQESLLLAAINYESYEMPPSGKLPQTEIDVLLLD